MARLATVGFELGNLVQERAASGQCSALSGSPTLDSSVKRTGEHSMKFDSSAGTTAISVRVPSGVTNDVWHYIRFYVYIQALPTTGTTALYTNPGTYAVRLNQSGQVFLATAAGTQIGSPSSALSLNTWYRIELARRVNTAAGADDSAELRLDGVTIASETNVARFTAISSNNDFGLTAGAPEDAVVNIDDIAINDANGANENSWPGEGRIVLLQPTGDVAVGANWQQPNTAGVDTTDLWQALLWPADGVAFADTDANALKFIFHNVTASTTNYVAETESYEDGGVPLDATIKLVQAVARLGSDNATNTSGAIALVENPDYGLSEDTITTFDASNVVAGTDPTGWFTQLGSPQYAPSVDLTLPTHVRVGKRTGTTRAAMIAAMGTYVEYVEAGETSPVAVRSSGVFGDIPVAVKESGTFQDVPVGVRSGGAWS